MVLRGTGFSGSKRTDNILCSLTVNQKSYSKHRTHTQHAHDFRGQLMYNWLLDANVAIARGCSFLTSDAKTCVHMGVQEI